jgi:hypothetical protein
MSKDKEDEYRDYALTSIELAKRQPEGANKSRLLLLADAWLDLAERTAERAKSRLLTVYRRRVAEEAERTPKGPDL